MGTVSVVIPCYNLGHTIQATVESAVQQTRMVNEVIVVDDGSTDPYTRQVLARLRHHLLQVVRTGNQGLSRARNHGVRLSRSAYVVLLDADDLLEPTYVERTAGCLDADPSVDFVSCALQAFEGASYRWLPNAAIVTGIVRGSLHASTLFRRNVFEAVGGFDPSMPAFEASDFWICAMEQGFVGRVLDEPLVRYRVRLDSKYHQAITGNRFLVAREALLRKHLPVVESRLSDVLADTDAFLVDVQRYVQDGQGRRAAASRRLQELDASFEGLRTQLAAANTDSFDGGSLRGMRPAGDAESGSLASYFVDRFIAEHRADIRGHVLTDDASRVEWFGCEVHQVDALEAVWSGMGASPAAGQATARRYDCVLWTNPIGDPAKLRAAIADLSSRLKPGGVLMAVFRAVGPFSGGDAEWRLTPAAVRRLMDSLFPADAYFAEPLGNVQACVGSLHGLTPEQAGFKALTEADPWFPLVTTVRACLPSSGTPNQTTASPALSRGTSSPHEAAVLMYHRVASVPTDQRQLAITPTHFRGHIEHLRRHFTPLSLEELTRHIRLGTIPERAVVVTLDDAYLDALTTVAPILKEFDVPATVFVNTLMLDLENEFWGDTIDRIFFEEVRLPPRIHLRLPTHEIDMPTGTTDQRWDAWRTVNEAFYPMNAEQRAALLENVIAWSGLDLPPRATHRRLTRKEVLELSRQPGITIGAHTTNHLDLAAHPPHVAWSEMAENKQALERLLDRPVLTFAYPYGIHNDMLVETARAIPFTTAVTTQDRLSRSGDDPLRLGRLEAPLRDVTVLRQYLETRFGGDSTPRVVGSHGPGA